MKIFVIVNPESANGKTGKKWPKIYDVLKNKISAPLEYAITERPAHALELAKRGIQKGYNAFVAVGGDGTVNEVVNGLMKENKSFPQGVKIGIISHGTGKDLIKTLGIPVDVESAAMVIADGYTKKFDLGEATFTDHDGKQCKRFFLNVGDLGFSAAVVERVNSNSKAFGGFISYLSGLFSTLITFRNKRITLAIDDYYSEERIVNSVNVANGKYFGGGMCIAPEAKADDGIFEIAVVGDITRRNVIANVGKLYRGTLASHPLVDYYRGNKVKVESSQRVLIDLDGEQLGTLPVTFMIKQKAIEIFVPKDVI